MTNTVENFLAKVQGSLSDDTFIKLSLGNYKGSEPHLQKISVRLIATKKGRRLYFQSKYDHRDIVKNFSIDEGIDFIRTLLRDGFRSGHLFTSENDVQIDLGKRNARLSSGKPTFSKRAEVGHDRTKNHPVDPGAFYLTALGITNESGQIRADQRDKWKQINKFVEILAGLYERSNLKGRKSVSILDMASGKGYLSFAVYDHFKRSLGLDVSMIGIDVRADMVEKCNSVAQAGGLSGLHFINSSIQDLKIEPADITIALHACDTATDDAIFKALMCESSIIVAAPCCHREVRNQMTSPDLLAGILRHPVLFERTAETITDGLRALLLERSGYGTKLFEFVPVEHTPKNNLLVAVKKDRKGRDGIDHEIRSIASRFGIKEQRLAALLSLQLLD